MVDRQETTACTRINKTDHRTAALGYGWMSLSGLSVRQLATPTVDAGHRGHALGLPEARWRPDRRPLQGLARTAVHRLGLLCSTLLAANTLSAPLRPCSAFSVLSLFSSVFEATNTVSTAPSLAPPFATRASSRLSHLLSPLLSPLPTRSTVDSRLIDCCCCCCCCCCQGAGQRHRRRRWQRPRRRAGGRWPGGVRPLQLLLSGGVHTAVPCLCSGGGRSCLLLLSGGVVLRRRRRRRRVSLDHVSTRRTHGRTVPNRL